MSCLCSAGGDRGLSARETSDQRRVYKQVPADCQHAGVRDVNLGGQSRQSIGQFFK